MELWKTPRKEQKKKRLWQCQTVTCCVASTTTFQACPVGGTSHEAQIPLNTHKINQEVALSIGGNPDTGHGKGIKMRIVNDLTIRIQAQFTRHADSDITHAHVHRVGQNIGINMLCEGSGELMLNVWFTVQWGTGCNKEAGGKRQKEQERKQKEFRSYAKMTSLRPRISEGVTRLKNV